MSQLRLFSVLLCLLLPVAGAAGETRLLRRPSVSRDLVAFAYASDLWAVGRTGGKARRLTSTPFVETDPHFSPDGSLIAFTATAGGNTDVYVMSALGGDPARLTYHPGIDAARGWSPDGRRVVIASTRGAVPLPSVSPYFRLWTSAEGHGPTGRGHSCSAFQVPGSGFGFEVLFGVPGSRFSVLGSKRRRQGTRMWNEERRLRNGHRRP